MCIHVYTTCMYVCIHIHIHIHIYIMYTSQRDYRRDVTSVTGHVFKKEEFMTRSWESCRALFLSVNRHFFVVAFQEHER